MQSLKISNLWALAVLYTLAVLLWQDLPARIPVHFDLEGRPDAYVDRSALAWFGLPATATIFVALFVFVLPNWMVRLARTNSPWLNMPDRTRFRALPAEARERVVARVVAFLPMLALLTQILLGYILYGTAQVAHQQWDRLPPLPGVGIVLAMLACALGLVVCSFRSVRTEVARVNVTSFPS